MSMTSELKAKGQEIINKSSEMKNIRTRLSGIMQDIKSKVASLNTSWDTEKASPAFQAQFTKTHKDIEEMLNVVDEYTHDLDIVGDKYIRVEGTVADASSQLPTTAW